MEVEIIKAKGAGEDTSTGRKIDRLRVVVLVLMMKIRLKVIIQWSDITQI